MTNRQSRRTALWNHCSFKTLLVIDYLLHAGELIILKIKNMLFSEVNVYKSLIRKCWLVSLFYSFPASPSEGVAINWEFIYESKYIRKISLSEGNTQKQCNFSFKVDKEEWRAAGYSRRIERKDDKVVYSCYTRSDTMH